MVRSPLRLSLILVMSGCDGATAPESFRVAEFELARPPHMSATFTPHQEFDIRELVLNATDPGGNDIPVQQLDRIEGTRVQWTWIDRHSGADPTRAPLASTSGWTVVVPDFASLAFSSNDWGAYPVRLRVWITGAGPEPLDGWGASSHPDDALPPPTWHSGGLVEIQTAGPAW